MIDRSTTRRAVAAAMIGNATEWYDYAVYGYLAVTLGEVFFPSTDATASLLSSFATFALAFAVRPLGALFFGPLTDKLGRQRTLAITILGMAGATVLIGLLPSYAAAGVLAPLCLVLLRMLQGFCVGGEYGGAATFAVECAPDSRRGFWASWLEFGAIGGFLLASAEVTALTLALPEDAMNAWGWRVPFLVAGVLGVVGLYLRFKLTESPAFRQLRDTAETSRTPVRAVLTGNWPGVLRCAGIVMYSSVGTYLVLTYMPSYLSETVGLPSGTAQLLVFAAGAALVALIPVAGAMSDRVGRKPMLLAAGLGYAALSYPAFWLLTQGHWYTAVPGLMLLVLCHAPILGTTTATLPALFPAQVRGTGVAVGYNTSFAVFGGTAPLLATSLVEGSGDVLAPAAYLAGIGLLALIPVAATPETARSPLPEADRATPRLQRQHRGAA